MMCPRRSDTDTKKGVREERLAQLLGSFHFWILHDQTGRSCARLTWIRIAFLLQMYDVDVTHDKTPVNAKNKKTKSADEG